MLQYFSRAFPVLVVALGEAGTEVSSERDDGAALSPGAGLPRYPRLRDLSLCQYDRTERVFLPAWCILCNLLLGQCF